MLPRQNHDMKDTMSRIFLQIQDFMTYVFPKPVSYRQTWHNNMAFTVSVITIIGSMESN